MERPSPSTGSNPDFLSPASLKTPAERRETGRRGRQGEERPATRQGRSIIVERLPTSLVKGHGRVDQRLFPGLPVPVHPLRALRLCERITPGSSSLRTPLFPALCAANPPSCSSCASWSSLSGVFPCDATEARCQTAPPVVSLAPDAVEMTL